MSGVPTVAGGVAVGVAAVLLALAAALLDRRWLLRPGRGVGAGGLRSWSGGRRRNRSRRRASSFGRGRRSASAGQAPLGVLCTQVASRLRSGASVEEAWRGALGRGGDGGPSAIGAATPDPAVSSDGDGVPRELVTRVGTSAAADAVVVACRLAHRCGTPLAEILDECAHGITEVEAADADRRRALAGPAATARLLVWLPVASLLIGAGMGADPLGSVLAGGPAALAVAAGTGFLLLGRWWIRRLVRVAERSGRGWG